MTRLLTLPPQSTHLPIPAIGYIRVSKAREEMISPELQELSIIEWAKRTNRHLVDIVPDLDVSGRTWHRKIMGVIERIERGEAREVIVWKYSRFGRDMNGCAVNLGRILRAGGELQSSTEDIDATTAVGRLSRDMLMAIASFESERMSEGWKETWAWRLEHGLPCRGGPRWGYELLGRLPDPLGHGTVRDPRVEEAYVPEESLRARITPDLYERRVERGTSYALLAEDLNARELWTLRGNPWSDTSLRRWMERGWSAGLVSVHNHECTRTHGKHVCPNRTHLPGAHDALIDVDLWEAFKEKSRRQSDRPRGTRAAKHLYTGVIWCRHCGGRHGGAPRAGDVRYTCSTAKTRRACSPRSIGERRITSRVLVMMGEYVDRIDAEARRAQAEAAKRAAEGKEPLAPADPAKPLRAQLARVEKRLGRLLDSHLDDLISRDEFVEKRAELEEEKAELKAKIKQAEATVEERQVVEKRVDIMRGLATEWETLPAGARRELVHQVVERIDVWRESRHHARLTIKLYGDAPQVHDVWTDFDANRQGKDQED